MQYREFLSIFKRFLIFLSMHFLVQFVIPTTQNLCSFSLDSVPSKKKKSDFHSRVEPTTFNVMGNPLSTELHIQFSVIILKLIWCLFFFVHSRWSGASWIGMGVAKCSFSRCAWSLNDSWDCGGCCVPYYTEPDCCDWCLLDYSAQKTQISQVRNNDSCPV